MKQLDLVGNQLEGRKLRELQALIDEMKHNPAFIKYVNERKLGLIDSRLEQIDALLRAGKLKG